MKIITSRQNEQLKLLSKLVQSAKHRREHRASVLEGVHLLSAYLDAGHLPKQVFVPEHRLTHPELSTQLRRLPENHITLVASGILPSISHLNDAEEVMTLMDLPISGSLKTTGDVIVLENLQDTGNIGTLLRSAAASGITDVILSKGCADVWSPKVLRAAMGAHFLLNVLERVDLVNWYATYRGRILATALSPKNPFSLYDPRLDLTQEGAWVFGNEGAGVSPECLARADATVTIPMLGKTESLNVAMAATICLFEQMRQRTS